MPRASAVTATAATRAKSAVSRVSVPPRSTHAPPSAVGAMAATGVDSPCPSKVPASCSQRTTVVPSVNQTGPANARVAEAIATSAMHAARITGTFPPG